MPTTSATATKMIPILNSHLGYRVVTGSERVGESLSLALVIRPQALLPMPVRLSDWFRGVRKMNKTKSNSMGRWPRMVRWSSRPLRNLKRRLTPPSNLHLKHQHTSLVRLSSLKLNAKLPWPLRTWLRLCLMVINPHRRTFTRLPQAGPASQRPRYTPLNQAPHLRQLAHTPPPLQRDDGLARMSRCASWFAFPRLIRKDDIVDVYKDLCQHLHRAWPQTSIYHPQSLFFLSRTLLFFWYFFLYGVVHVFEVFFFC